MTDCNATTAEQCTTCEQFLECVMEDSPYVNQPRLPYELPKPASLSSKREEKASLNNKEFLNKLLALLGGP